MALRGLSVSAEARALAALRGHPSIVTVHALGVHRGIEYAVMDWIDGITLEERLERAYAERAPLGIAEVVRVGAAVAEGLAVVHAAGMAHRDVKPGNVILAPDDRIVITDFGIFQPECEREESTILWGTPEYMAPEASCGQIVPGEMFLVDVYALGVVLFEMLTGSVPFHGGSAAHVMSMHLTELVPDPRVTRPDAPRELAALVRGLMAKAPRARPQGMREIAWQLRHLRGDVARRRGPFSTLIAEDNPATAAILASLVGEGARDGEIRVARDGREALEMVQERPPDLLVVDLHLPVMSGLELCARLAETELVRGCKSLARARWRRRASSRPCSGWAVFAICRKGRSAPHACPDSRATRGRAPEGDSVAALRPRRRRSCVAIRDERSRRDPYARVRAPDTHFSRPVLEMWIRQLPSVPPVRRHDEVESKSESSGRCGCGRSSGSGVLGVER